MCFSNKHQLLTLSIEIDVAGLYMEDVHAFLILSRINSLSIPFTSFLAVYDSFLFFFHRSKMWSALAALNLELFFINSSSGTGWKSFKSTPAFSM